jgi:4-hydroxy-4-methyl-2-oxoglutarate aldolase
MPKEGLSQTILARLRLYDTPTICNAIELFEVRPRNAGFMNQQIQACFPEMPPMVGYAATATFRSDAPARGDAYTSLDRQIESFQEVPEPPVVVFQDLDDPPVAATFGEVMCTSYQAFGAVGLITSGAGRDLDQVQALRFSVFTNGTICAHGYCHVPSVQVPVHVGGMTIYAGDLLHGDRNGVTTIPHDIAPEVADVCQAFFEAEAVVLGYLKSGSPTIKGMAEARQESQNMMEEVRKRVSRRR